MVFKKFEDLIAWQKAQDFAVDIYAIFDASKDYNYRNQICSAYPSIYANDRSSDAFFILYLVLQ